MKILFEDKEVLAILHDVFSNGALGYLGISSVVLNKKGSYKNDYLSAKKRLQEKNPDQMICYEDVLIEILRGINDDPNISKDCNYYLEFIDEEAVETHQLTLIKAKENFQNAEGHLIENMIDIVKDTGVVDAEQGYCILQQAIFGEVIFG